MKYLKSLVCLFLVGSFASSSFGQEDLKWSKKEFGASFYVDGLIQNLSLSNPQSATGQPFLFVKHGVREDLILRYGLGMDNFNAKTSSVDSLGNAEILVDSTFKQSNFYLGLGVEKHFSGTNRLDPYVGLDLVLGVIGKESINTVETARDTTGDSRLNTIEEYAGGTSFGANLIFGTNYFIAKKLSLGAEFVWGFQSIVTGGDYSRVQIFEPVAGTGTTTREIGSLRRTSSGMRMDSSVHVTLSYYFDPRSKKE